MAPTLKPLLLPQLVEARKKLELQQDDEGELVSVYYAYNSSASDLASPSPISSTFSRTGLPRFSGSTSSLELATPSFFDSPPPPTQTQPLHGSRNSKPLLPDVQEEPLERDAEDAPAAFDHGYHDFGLYDCLCDVTCSHHEDLAQSPTVYSYMTSEYDYDLGFLSDGDFNGSLLQKKKRHGSDAGFSSWGARLGSRLPSLPRWRSAAASRRHDLTFSPASDSSLVDRRPSFAGAASSRSSSISGPVRGTLDRSQDSDIPTTPALSFDESSESIALPSPLETMSATWGKSLERARATATTPLLPPLLIEASAACQAQPHSLYASPLQSPSMVSSPGLERAAPHGYPTPPISTKPSVSSLRRGTVSSTISDAPSPVPCFFDHQDSWSDRLGHANFTIEPRPYLPETADLPTLQAFRADWNLGRTNYAKHLVRTGEHYGATSKTYVLTEAKWAEIEQDWRRNEDDLVERLGQQWKDDPSVTSQLRRTAEGGLSPSIPRMLSDDGKFPELGDVEIIGPMVRDAVMVRDGQDERRNSASVWLKSLAGKVGLRK